MSSPWSAWKLQLAGVFSLMAAIPLMLGGFMFSDPNMTVDRVLSWVPLDSADDDADVPPDGRGADGGHRDSIVMLIITILAVLWAGSKVLLYRSPDVRGKRPGLKQIIKALREA